MATDIMAAAGAASHIRNAIAGAWRTRASAPLLHIAWQRVRDGEYTGTVGGQRVTLLFLQHYETVKVDKNSRLRDPARTRNGLSVECDIGAANHWLHYQQPLTDLAVRGEGARAMERFDTHRRNLEARALRVFGFTPEWETI